MKHLLSYCILGVLVILSTAWIPFPSPPRIIKIEVTNSGYSPKQIEMKKGETIKLVVVRKTDSPCLKQIQFPTFGIKATDLPKGKPVEFVLKSDKEGSFSFACGMNMMKGTVLVKN